MTERTRCENDGCNRLFKKRRYWQKFCSTKCSTDYHTKTRRRALALLRSHEAQESQEDIK